MPIQRSIDRLRVVKYIKLCFTNVMEISVIFILKQYKNVKTASLVINKITK